MVLGNTFHLFLAPGPELIERARRPQPVHALAAADHHRLGRLSGVLDGPRQRRRRDQGPTTRRRRQPATVHRATARSWRSARRASASAPTSTDTSGCSAPRARWPSRRRCTRTSRSCSTSARRFTSPVSTPRGRPSAPTAGSSGACAGTNSTGPRDQAVYGIVQGGVEHDLRLESAGRDRRERVRRDRDRRHARPRQAADVRGRLVGDRRARAARPRAPAPPARDRRRRRSHQRRRAWDRHVRLRDADPARRATGWRSCPIRPAAGGSTWPRAPGASPTSRSSTAAHARRAAPATPAPTSTTCCARGELTGAAAAHAPQPALHRAADG